MDPNITAQRMIDAIEAARYEARPVDPWREFGHEVFGVKLPARFVGLDCKGRMPVQVLARIIGAAPAWHAELLIVSEAGACVETTKPDGRTVLYWHNLPWPTNPS